MNDFNTIQFYFNNNNYIIKEAKKKYISIL